MHELSVAQSILDIIKVHADRKGIEKVSRIGLKIGEFSCIEPSSLTFCFDVIKKDTLVAVDAVLDMEKEPAKGFCNDCEKEFYIKVLIVKCPLCEGKSVQVSGGDEMKVAYMEAE